MTKSPALYVGALSGTSVDGLDLALIAIEGPDIACRAGRTVPLDLELTRLLHGLASGTVDSIDDFGRADHLLGATIAESVLTFLRDLGIPPGAVRAIGSHGQTVRHRPEADRRYTLQLGDPNVIAEVTGIDCVADFRRRDLAAGGEGAPLVPPFHRAIFQSAAERRVVLNIGGIANVSMLPEAPDDSVRGFDTGPGNTLLDHWIRRVRGLPFDDRGAWAASGSVCNGLLADLLEHPYFAIAPPKSTGRETFGAAWLDSHLAVRSSLEPADVQATLLELTAHTIADGIRGHDDGGRTVIVCGGGRHNTVLMHALAEQLPGYRIAMAESFGFDGDHVEAAAFAWLAHRAIEGAPGNAPAVTGARGPRPLGGLYPGGIR
jgi:anhydro-N-acetylmuramic acid kinase